MLPGHMVVPLDYGGLAVWNGSSSNQLDRHDLCLQGGALCSGGHKASSITMRKLYSHPATQQRSELLVMVSSLWNS